jgi:nucleotide-binding universal stress UspA family protein
VKRILEKAAASRGVDLEAWETALRAAVLAAGAKALSGLIEGIGSGRGCGEVRCSCGGRMESLGRKSKTLLTILGKVSYARTLLQCSACQATRFPGDEVLDVVGTGRSPGLRRLMARAGSKATFKEGRDDLRIYAGIQVSAKDVERVAERIGGEMEVWSQREREDLGQEVPSVCRKKGIPILYVSYDGVGVPMTPAELVGRRGKQADGSARTREAKLGCVFTQTGTDEKGFPVRDPESTSFVAAIETSDEFGWRIYAEAVRRGLDVAQRVVVLGDAAEWIRTIAAEHFPEAIQIIDLYHGREHVSGLCKLLFGSNGKEVVRHRIRWWTYLDENQVERIIQQAKEKLSSVGSEYREMAQREVNFLDKNKERMRYKTFRAMGLFVGSGVVEAGCKTLIGHRLKQSGMEWSVRGANAILSLRCTIQSGRLEEYWESRVS